MTTPSATRKRVGKEFSLSASPQHSWTEPCRWLLRICLQQRYATIRHFLNFTVDIILLKVSSNVLSIGL